MRLAHSIYCDTGGRTARYRDSQSQCIVWRAAVSHPACEGIIFDSIQLFYQTLSGALLYND